MRHSVTDGIQQGSLQDLKAITTKTSEIGNPDYPAPGILTGGRIFCFKCDLALQYILQRAIKHYCHKHKDIGASNNDLDQDVNHKEING